MIKYLLLPVICVCLSNCLRPIPQGYLGGSVIKSEIKQESYDYFNVVIYRQNSELSAANIRSTLERIGIEYSEDTQYVRFHCSRAALIGFLATVSENGTVTAPFGTHEISCGRIGFPVEARGGITIIAAEH